VYTTINTWMKDCPPHILKELGVVAPKDGITRSFYPEVEADFDVFTDDLSANTQGDLAALVTEKILPANELTAWHKVFVKDDCGCNAVGMCIFGNEHLKSSTFDPHRNSSGERSSGERYSSSGERFSHGERSSTGGHSSAGDSESEHQKIFLTREHRMQLRVRKAKGRVAGGEAVQYVLQEGIPTGLTNTKTGAQLEVVLMLADGQAYTYFVREAPLSKHLSKDDHCECLNVPGVRFVSRPEFETAPDYADAFAQVKNQWPRYLLAGTLCMLALAKQKQAYVNQLLQRDQARLEEKRVSNAKGTALKQTKAKIQAPVLAEKAHKQQITVAKEAPLQHAAATPPPAQVPACDDQKRAEQFSKSLSGQMLKTLNGIPKDWKSVSLPEGLSVSQPATAKDKKTKQKNHSTIAHHRLVTKSIREFLATSYSDFDYTKCGNPLLEDLASRASKEESKTLWEKSATTIIDGVCAEIVELTNSLPPSLPSLVTSSQESESTTEQCYLEYDPISKLLLKTYVKLQASRRGLIYTDAGSMSKATDDSKRLALQMPPVTLLPSIFPHDLQTNLLGVVDAIPAINDVVDKVICDVDFLLTQLDEVGITDEFIRGLLNIAKDVYVENKKDPLDDPRLHLFRHDFLALPDNTLKQVEINTMAVAFAGFSDAVAQMHADTMRVFPAAVRTPGAADSDRKGQHGKSFQPLPPRENQPVSGGSAASYARGLQLAHEAYCERHQAPDAKICFLCFEDDHLDLDQRLIQKQKCLGGDAAFTALWDDALVVDLEPRGGSSVGGVLKINGREVSVAYFHTTYSPQHFKGTRDWAIKQLIEESSAVKVPSVLGQLANSKKIQQVLSKREVLAKFWPVDDAEGVTLDAVLALAAVQVDVTDVGDAFTRKTMEDAVQNPDMYVLKPQREGGGNNFYGADLKSRVLSLLQDQDPGRNDDGSSGGEIDRAFTLMERIPTRPFPTTGALLSQDGIVGKWGAPVVSEFGVFSVCFKKGGSEGNSVHSADSTDAGESNYVGGVFARTKTSESDEGGVCEGHGYLDTPWFAAE
jgi:glutathione synthase